MIRREACDSVMAMPGERPSDLLERIGGDFSGLPLEQLRDIEADTSLTGRWRHKARQALARHGWVAQTNASGSKDS